MEETTQIEALLQRGKLKGHGVESDSKAGVEDKVFEATVVQDSDARGPVEPPPWEGDGARSESVLTLFVREGDSKASAEAAPRSR